MPLLIYLPVIVWLGMVDAARDDVRAVPARLRR